MTMEEELLNIILAIMEKMAKTERVVAENGLKGDVFMG